MKGSDEPGASEDRRVIDLSCERAEWNARSEGFPGEENLIAWPVKVGDPPLRAQAFQERPGLQGAIEDALSRGLVAILTTSPSAPGGTQMALSTFQAACRAGTDLVVWVQAGSRESVLSTYAAARTATTPGATVTSGRVVERARAFLAWLSTTDRTWFVVLDGVVDPDHLHHLWPSGPRGRVVVTTRKTGPSFRGPEHVVIRTGPFEPSESLSYLSTRLGTVEDLPVGVLDGATELMADLGRIPSALAQAATVIAQSKNTCSGYREMLGHRARSHDTWMPGADVRAAHTGRTVPTTDGGTADGPSVDRRLLAASCLLTVQAAVQQDPGGPTARLLDLIAVMDPAGIPEILLTCGPVREGLATRPEPGAGPLRVLGHHLRSAVSPGRRAVSEGAIRQAMWNLRQYHLIDHDPDVGVVRCGALTRQVVLGLLEASRRSSLVRLAADALDNVWPETEDDPVLGRMLRSNASALLATDSHSLWSPRPHPVLALLGRSLAEVGLAGEATDHLRRLAEVAAEILGQDHPHVVRIRQEAGHWTPPRG